ncbi:hypothetical protein LWF15_26700 [Kineosporia rhizophila]|uniref:hypothetical protein n=1 Tax=Kineosporia TaxID=49184 RepID=UPI001E2BBE8A|nr:MULTISPECIES: hypothetical protein [Kineosporia]MCE0539095.1 hypothetical protein [Kineosporia rhizophila]GLY17803.1 dehydrogenase [Kineosporia sp. NBRC 101677]
MGALNGSILTTPQEQVGAATESVLSVADRPRTGNIDRSAADSAERVAEAVRDLAGRLDPAGLTGPLLPLWQTLAALGHSDLCVARLAEGHIDALRILAEAGREPAPGAVYGVWASASGGTGLKARSTPEGWNVEGTMRFCSGAWFLDRALTVISTDAGPVLVDVDVRQSALTRREDTWPAVGMDATRSVDVEVHDLAVPAGAAVGGPGFYLERPGFTLGGAGVAAVWLGGAHGVLNSILTTADPDRASPHHRAHLGAMAVAIASADALLSSLAGRGEPLDLPDMTAARSAVEAAVTEVLTRAPRVTGPNGLCRNARIAHQLADLEIYVRQHHAEADHELAGTHLLRTGTLLGRAFR